MATLFFSEVLGSIADRGAAILGLAPGGRATSQAAIALCHRLLSSQGEAAGIALSQQVLSVFAKLDQAEKGAFFQKLQKEFGVSDDRLKAAARAYLDTPDPANLAEVTEATRPRRQDLLTRLNHAPDGMQALMRMRTDLLRCMRDRPDLRAVDNDFVALFSSWFNRGFLELRTIDWNSPATLLEKIIRYEAVHGISDWDDLRARIDPPDRHVFGFFHANLGDEPLIFVEVALMAEMPSDIATILDRDDPPLDTSDARVGVFYSISNCQNGLVGIPLGNFLIKQVVETLRRQYPRLSQFATLSPVPTLAGWALSQDDVPLDDAARALLQAVGKGDDDSTETAARLEKLIPQLTAWYLLNVKNAKGLPSDPVARFHLGNGAALARINWPGDLSPQGRSNAFGAMVNYEYRLEKIEQNHEGFANHATVAASVPVQRLARALETGRRRMAGAARD